MVSQRVKQGVRTYYKLDKELEHTVVILVVKKPRLLNTEIWQKPLKKLSD